MALGTRRDPDEVLAGFGDWLRDRDPAGEPAVVGHERPSVGFSTETMLVDVQRDRSAVDRDPRDERLVLKLPPAGPGIFPTYDFALQAGLQEAAAEGGVPAPVPVQVEDDPRWIGVPFLVMPAIAGHIVDEMPALDPWLTASEPDRNRTVHGHYVDIVAAVNGIDWRSGLSELVPARDNEAELAHWREYLGWYGEGAVLVPMLVDALDWCAEHRPASEPPSSLLWGDVRLGNVIFDDERNPVAVLDWEMATIGAAEHDLAWMLALDAIQDELLGRKTAGFLDRDAVVARYEQRLGRSVRDVAWYETFAMVRSASIMTRIAHLRDRAGQPPLLPMADNPVLDILRRRIGRNGALPP